MSFGFSATDIISLAQTAWKIYTQLRDAPTEIQAITDDLGLLHAVLRSMNENVLDTTSLASRDLQDIKVTMERCRNVLSELQDLADKYGNKPFGMRSRVKIQFEDVKSIKARLRMALDGLNSFNNAVSLSLQLKLDASQELILKALNRIQVDVQAGKREGSTISKTVLDDERDAEDDILRDVLQELENEGISRHEIIENKQSISRWILKGVRNGDWQESFSPEPSPYYTISVRAADDSRFVLGHQCRIEILSATFGARDVTDKMRRFLMTNVHSSTATRLFHPTNNFFGGYPNAEGTAFVMVWRKRLSWDKLSRYKYSQTQTLVAAENERVLFLYDDDMQPVDSGSYSATDLNILNATYIARYGFFTDVTSLVVRLIKDPFQVSNFQFGDPHFGLTKDLTVTYSYGPPDDLTDIHVKTVHEGSQFYIPPPLKVIAANIATVDITDLLRAQVSPDQTLTLDLSRHICDEDPLPNYHKTIAVLCQYGDEPIQIIAKSEGSDILKIEPSALPQKSFLSNMPPQDDNSFHILGGVWGVLPLDLRHYGLMMQSREFPCTNEWFGFDGRPGEVKSCQIFVHDRRDGNIRCISALEGTVLRLPD
ncbi:MAG: hypothetical protein M1820_006593 [Bogoriella megaspora]|nr:MAG: hypothetical protein M1820_006593 [Bogoriella megaspora]